MNNAIDITAAQRKIILALLRKHLPNTTAWVYGSRATWNARPQSDLDMVVFTAPAQERGVSALRDAFEESALPFRVDLFVWDAVPESFHKQIEVEHVVLVEKEERGMSGETLAHFVTITMGQSPSSDTVVGRGGVPLLNGPTEFGPYHPTPVQFTTNAHKRARPGDILFCVRGSTTGRMNWADQEYAIGRGIASICHRETRELQPFVRAVIEFGLPDLLVQATGSTFPNVSAAQLGALPYPNLSKAEQRAIAHILGTLDDKIELNRRMNETLEEMARALFKSWFVDFDPVHAKAALKRHAARLTSSVRASDFPSSEGWPEGPGWVSDRAAGATHPAADAAPLPGGDHDLPPHGSSPLSNCRVLSPHGGGEWTVERAQAYLENLGQEIADLFPDAVGDDDGPIEWGQRTLYGIAEFANGAAYKNMHFSPGREGLPVIKIAELKHGVTASTKFTKTKLGERYRINTGEILFSWSGNPDTSIDTFIWDDGAAWLNQHIFRVRENGNATRALIYFQLRQLKPVLSEIARNKQTTGLGHITVRDMKELIVCDPPKPVVDAFEEIAGPMFLRVIANLIENKALARTRDLLLPRLMSGEIRLDESVKAPETVT